MQCKGGGIYGGTVLFDCIPYLPDVCSPRNHWIMFVFIHFSFTGVVVKPVMLLMKYKHAGLPLIFCVAVHNQPL
jgi:hypothetical protein